MKKINYILFVLIIALSFACKKEDVSTTKNNGNNGGGGGISYPILIEADLDFNDGSSYHYKGVRKNNPQNVGVILGDTSIQISAKGLDNDYTLGFILTTKGGVVLTPGTYDAQGSDNTMLFSYLGEAGTYGWGNHYYDANGDYQINGTVTIEQISASSIKGTFSAQLFQGVNDPDHSVQITNGKFSGKLTPM